MIASELLICVMVSPMEKEASRQGFCPRMS